MRAVHNLTIQKKTRQYLRNNATKAEKIFWQELRNNKIGVKFRRQHGIKGYVVDFYCPKLKLIIELDGVVHDFRKQRERDYLKEKELEKLNFKVIRYNNFDIMENIGEVMKDLRKYL
ncbi:MAG: endonuclease domain-containing protein [Patescibacteria group bacterium]|nr:endonuclease domain-containing protein [Patescibacteria group bacterium]